VAPETAKEAIKVFRGSIIYKLNINNAGTKVENIR